MSWDGSVEDLGRVAREVSIWRFILNGENVICKNMLCKIFMNKQVILKIVLSTTKILSILD